MKTYRVTVDDCGTQCWYHNDKLHREGAPAIESANGNKYWYHNDKLHREGGPALEWADGKWWYINGQLHREDGPAIEWANGNKYWFLNDKELTEAEFNARIKQSSCDGRVVEIDGKKYKLQAV